MEGVKLDKFIKKWTHSTPELRQLFEIELGLVIKQEMMKSSNDMISNKQMVVHSLIDDYITEHNISDASSITKKRILRKDAIQLVFEIVDIILDE